MIDVGRLEMALRELVAKAPIRRAEYADLVARARAHATDPAGAGAALEEIARQRLYRLDGHVSFGAFVLADLGLSRSTAVRLRAQAPARRARARAASQPARIAAAAIERWLDRRQIAHARIEVVQLEGVACVQLVLSPRDVMHLTAPPPKERARSPAAKNRARRAAYAKLDADFPQLPPLAPHSHRALPKEHVRPAQIVALLRRDRVLLSTVQESLGRLEPRRARVFRERMLQEPATPASVLARELGVSSGRVDQLVKKASIDLGLLDRTGRYFPWDVEPR